MWSRALPRERDLAGQRHGYSAKIVAPPATAISSSKLICTNSAIAAALPKIKAT